MKSELLLRICVIDLLEIRTRNKRCLSKSKQQGVLGWGVGEVERGAGSQSKAGKLGKDRDSEIAEREVFSDFYTQMSPLGDHVKMQIFVSVGLGWGPVPGQC